MTTSRTNASPELDVAARPLVRSGKIATRHLSRVAIVYVRQSSPRQVRENIESTQLQYDLVNRARAYGWPREQIEIVDDDLGVSGQSLEGRKGFQRLLAEISLGHVGIVLGIEMSRLARNCRDWHHLLELCAVFDSLLGDADGVYNPREHNDRLLLGLKGTMSEAELHVLRGRLDAGRRNKASRGEFFCQAPIGYVRALMAWRSIQMSKHAMSCSCYLTSSRSWAVRTPCSDSSERKAFGLECGSFREPTAACLSGGRRIAAPSPGSCTIRSMPAPMFSGSVERISAGELLASRRQGVVRRVRTSGKSCCATSCRLISPGNNGRRTSAG